MTTMTYGQLVEAYVAVRKERDRLRADDLAIRRLLRDHGASVGDVDPLPAVIAETLDAARKTGVELVELRDRHEQVCEELAEARRGCERLRRENADLRAQLAEARQQRDQATGALADAITRRGAVSHLRGIDLLAIASGGSRPTTTGDQR